MTLSVASSSFAPNFKMKQDEYQKKYDTKNPKTKPHTHVARMFWKLGGKKTYMGQKEGN